MGQRCNDGLRVVGDKIDGGILQDDGGVRNGIPHHVEGGDFRSELKMADLVLAEPRDRDCVPLGAEEAGVQAIGVDSLKAVVGHAQEATQGGDTGIHFSRSATIFEKDTTGIRAVDGSAGASMKEDFADTMGECDRGEFDDVFGGGTLAGPATTVHGFIADGRRNNGRVVIRVTTPFGNPDGLGSTVGPDEILQCGEGFFEQFGRARSVVHVKVEDIKKSQAAVGNEVVSEAGVESGTETTHDAAVRGDGVDSARSGFEDSEIIGECIAEAARKSVVGVKR